MGDAEHFARSYDWIYSEDLLNLFYASSNCHFVSDTKIFSVLKAHHLLNSHPIALFSFLVTIILNDCLCLMNFIYCCLTLSFFLLSIRFFKIEHGPRQLDCEDLFAFGYLVFPRFFFILKQLDLQSCPASILPFFFLVLSFYCWFELWLLILSAHKIAIW